MSGGSTFVKIKISIGCNSLKTPFNGIVTIELEYKIVYLLSFGIKYLDLG